MTTKTGKEGEAVGHVQDVLSALKGLGHEVIAGKGGFWLKGIGFISLTAARKLVCIEAPKRAFRPKIRAWGDFATVAMLNGAK